MRCFQALALATILAGCHSPIPGTDSASASGSTPFSPIAANVMRLTAFDEPTVAPNAAPAAERRATSKEGAVLAFVEQQEATAAPKVRQLVGLRKQVAKNRDGEESSARLPKEQSAVGVDELREHYAVYGTGLSSRIVAGSVASAKAHRSLTLVAYPNPLYAIDGEKYFDFWVGDDNEIALVVQTEVNGSP